MVVCLVCCLDEEPNPDLDWDLPELLLGIVNYYYFQSQFIPELNLDLSFFLV